MNTLHIYFEYDLLYIYHLHNLCSKSCDYSLSLCILFFIKCDNSAYSCTYMCLY